MSAVFFTIGLYFCTTYVVTVKVGVDVTVNRPVHLPPPAPRHVGARGHINSVSPCISPSGQFFRRPFLNYPPFKGRWKSVFTLRPFPTHAVVIVFPLWCPHVSPLDMFCRDLRGKSSRKMSSLYGPPTPGEEELGMFWSAGHLPGPLLGL